MLGGISGKSSMLRHSTGSLRRTGQSGTLFGFFKLGENVAEPEFARVAALATITMHRICEWPQSNGPSAGTTRAVGECLGVEAFCRGVLSGKPATVIKIPKPKDRSQSEWPYSPNDLAKPILVKCGNRDRQLKITYRLSMTDTRPADHPFRLMVSLQGS